MLTYFNHRLAPPSTSTRTVAISEERKMIIFVSCHVAVNTQYPPLFQSFRNVNGFKRIFRFNTRTAYGTFSLSFFSTLSGHHSFVAIEQNRRSVLFWGPLLTLPQSILVHYEFSIVFFFESIRTHVRRKRTFL